MEVKGTPVIAKAVQVALLTGGFDRPYAFGLSRALLAKHVHLDVIGSDAVDSPEMHSSPGLNFLNLQRGWRPHVSLARKILRLLALYARLIRYTACAKPKVFHILWNTKIALFDRILLMLIYKAFGKRIALTAHNVNTKKRDGTDSLLNRLTLKVQYQLADHIFVHTKKMQRELVSEFGVGAAVVTVIPFGINNSLRQTHLTAEEAKSKLGVDRYERAMLFFGRIKPYKGLDDLIEALHLLVTRGTAKYRLIIAGEVDKEYRRYWADIQQKITRLRISDQTYQRIEHIPDSETELYFKAADVSVLPYADIYQSGVLFLGFSFGLPAVATDVGCFSEDIVEGSTGFLCRPHDPGDLVRAIERYFGSDLYGHLAERRKEIREYATGKHSWEEVGDMTRRVYEALLEGEARH